MHCLVTGASGHLGVAVVHELLSHGHDVTAMVRTASPPSGLADVWHQLRILKGDLTDVAAMEAQLAADCPEVCFHMAWSGVGNEYHNDSRQINWNLRGSLDLIELVARMGCRQWIGLGSQAEYGRVDGLLNEDIPMKPETTYGIVKQALGSVGAALAHSYGMRHAWLRLLATYGPHDDPRHLIPYVINTLLAGRLPELTRGEQVWDYLYVEDAAVALRLVAEKQIDGVYNLASGQGYVVSDLVTQIRDLIDPSLPLGIGTRNYAENQIMYLQGDISRLCEAISWLPNTSLTEGLKQTVNWHRHCVINKI